MLQFKKLLEEFYDFSLLLQLFVQLAKMIQS